MKKTMLIKYLNKLFEQYYFIKNKSNWLLEEDNIIKIIKLSKSKYGDNYYINYGYVIKNLELSGLEMHVFNTLSSINEKYNERIKELLNLDIVMNDNDRLQEIRDVIEIEILSKFKKVHNENNILEELKERSQLNDIPLIVKNHFNIVG